MDYEKYCQLLQHFSKQKPLLCKWEEFEDIKAEIIIRKSKDRQLNGQAKMTNDKQQSTKHYT